jgi:uncharacterized protein (DUF983 family)
MTGKKFLKFNAEVVTGVCPTCEMNTMLVGITPDFYRCISCGSDLKQHINGKISYIPAAMSGDKIELTTRDKTSG